MSHQHLPPIIELAGLPGSGKTTTANLVGQALSERSLAFHLIPEAASKAPIQHLKQHWLFNAWTLCATLKEYLETDLMDERAKVIIDRGFVDCLCWIMWFRTTGRIDTRTARALEAFATASAWFDKTVLTVVLRCQFPTAVIRRGEEGKIVNEHTFAELQHAYDVVIERMLKRNEGPPLLVLETDQLTRIEVREKVLARIGDSI